MNKSELKIRNVTFTATVKDINPNEIMAESDKSMESIIADFISEIDDMQNYKLTKKYK